jgi:hypothetical protein
MVVHVIQKHGFFILYPSLNTKFKYEFSEADPNSGASCFNFTLNRRQIRREFIFLRKQIKQFKFYILNPKF